MKNQILKTFTPAVGLIGLLAFLFTLTGCQNPASSASAPTNLAGKIYDGATALPLAGATVYWGSTSATTAADGSFSIPLGQSSGTIVSDFGVYKAGYNVVFLKSFPIDSANPPSVSLPILQSIAPTATHTLSISPLMGSNGAEVATGTSVEITLMANGVDDVTTLNQSYTQGSGISLTSTIATSNTLVRIDELSNGQPIASTWIPHVDLSGTATNLGTVTLAANSNTQFTGSPASSGSLALYYYTGQGFDYVFLPSNQYSLPVPPVSPSGTVAVDYSSSSTTSDGYTVSSFALTNPLASLGTSIPLPTLPTAVFTSGPTVKPSYNSTSKTLTVGSVAGASLYFLQISSLTNSTNKLYVGIFSTSNSVVLPDWLVKVLAGNAVTLSYQALNYTLSLSQWFNGFLNLSSPIPAGSGSYLSGSSGSNMQTSLQF